MKKAFLLVAMLLLASTVFGQSLVRIPGPGGNSAGGTSVTINLGGTTDDTHLTDTGNANLMMLRPILTPASMASASWGNGNVSWRSPDSGTPNWGWVLFSNLAFTGTVSTSNTGTGGCTSNTVTLSAGTNFTTGAAWVGAVIQIGSGGKKWFVLSVQSATVLCLTNPPGTQSSVSYTVNTPGGTKLCSGFSSTVASVGFNPLAVTGTGCPAPASSTLYWLGIATKSATQSIGRVNTVNFCADTVEIPWLDSTSLSGGLNNNNSWPSTPSASVNVGDQCIAAYMNLTYNTTQPATIISYNAASCDAPTTSCSIDIAPTTAGHSYDIFCNTSTTKTCSTPTDSAGDTFTLVGSPPSNVGTSSMNPVMYHIDRISTGVTNVTGHYSASNKVDLWMVESQGPIASSSVDQICYDSATGTTPHTSCTTSTTSQASELLLSFVVNQLQGTCCGAPTDAVTFTPNDSSSLLGSAGTSGSSPWVVGTLIRTLNSTGTYNTQVNSNPSFGGSDGIFSTVLTLKLQ